MKGISRAIREMENTDQGPIDGCHVGMQADIAGYSTQLFPEARSLDFEMLATISNSENTRQAKESISCRLNLALEFPVYTHTWVQ